MFVTLTKSCTIIRYRFWTNLLGWSVQFNKQANNSKSSQDPGTLDDYLEMLHIEWQFPNFFDDEFKNINVFVLVISETYNFNFLAVNFMIISYYLGGLKYHY